MLTSLVRIGTSFADQFIFMYLGFFHGSRLSSPSLSLTLSSAVSHLLESMFSYQVPSTSSCFSANNLLSYSFFILSSFFVRFKSKSKNGFFSLISKTLNFDVWNDCFRTFCYYHTKTNQMFVFWRGNVVRLTYLFTSFLSVNDLFIYLKLQKDITVTSSNS